VLAWTAFGGAVACLVALFAVMTVTRLPDWDSVGRYWETVAEDNPNAGFAQAALASVDWQAGRIEEAEAGYQRALAGDLDDRRRALVLIDLGALRAGREDYDGAAAAYYEGIGLFSGFWDLHYNLALARWKQALLTDPPDAAHLREAYDAAGRAAEINDDAPELFLLQGLIAKDAGDRDAAEVALRRVLDLDPNAATARSARDALEQLDQSP
jgi:tetratricopeptide (TPR) repeat protein